jgi:hypothetical protein
MHTHRDACGFFWPAEHPDAVDTLRAALRRTGPPPDQKDGSSNLVLHARPPGPEAAGLSRPF